MQLCDGDVKRTFSMKGANPLKAATNLGKPPQANKPLTPFPNKLEVNAIRKTYNGLKDSPALKLYWQPASPFCRRLC